jgi:hypothetical protein
VFSLGTPVSSTNKTNRHDIIELLLKMALNIITLTLSEPDFVIKTILVLTIVYVSISIINYMVKMILQPVVINMNIKPEALKSLYRSPGYKKKPIGPM